MDWLDRPEEVKFSDDEDEEPVEEENPPPTTRWNPRTPRRGMYTGRRAGQMDNIRTTSSAPNAKQDKRDYRRWQSRISRTPESRSICWFGDGHFLGKDDYSQRCFVCKLELETEPSQLKSFPFSVWVRAGEKGCVHCRQVVLGTRKVTDLFTLPVDKLHLATVAVDDRGFGRWSRRGDDEKENTERFTIALFWVDENGDNSENLVFQRRKKRLKNASVNAVDDTDLSPESAGRNYGLHNQARLLLETCNREHACRQSTQSFRPTRLVELLRGRDGPKVRIVRSSTIPPETSVEYVALSYCWGTKLPLRLQKPTIEDMETGIPWPDLPKLFQDMMNFTLDLNLRYLWIDALCIIQDDHSDWEREAAQMGSIYFHSYVTIGATSSRDSTDPLAMVPFQCIPIEFVEEDRYEFVNMSTRGGDLTWPLHHRGWAYQEILLPARYLDFDSNGLNLHCCNGTTRAPDSLSLSPYTFWSEDYNRDYFREWGQHTSSQSFRQPWTFRWLWTQVLRGNGKDVNGKTIQMWQAWQEVVMMYTNRRLTYSTDRLPALGGLAAEYKRRSGPGEAYYAGLWKNSFIQLLSWKVGLRGDEPTSVLKGPSWSWASIDGIIDYGQNYSFMEIGQLHAEVKDASVKRRDSNPFGEVESGYVVLKGVLSWCVLEKSKWSEGGFRLRGLNGADIHADFEPDMEIENAHVYDEEKEVAHSARRVVGTRSKAAQPAPFELCAVLLVHLYNYWDNQRVFLVLGVVDIVEKEFIFQRLGVAECRWYRNGKSAPSESLEDKSVFLDDVKII